MFFSVLLVLGTHREDPPPHIIVFLSFSIVFMLLSSSQIQSPITSLPSTHYPRPTNPPTPSATHPLPGSCPSALPFLAPLLTWNQQLPELHAPLNPQIWIFHPVSDILVKFNAAITASQRLSMLSLWLVLIMEELLAIRELKSLKTVLFFLPFSTTGLPVLGAHVRTMKACDKKFLPFLPLHGLIFIKITLLPFMRRLNILSTKF